MRPHIVKHGPAWRVYIGEHMHSSHASHPRAWRAAYSLATHKARTRLTADLYRIRTAIQRMEHHAA